MRYNCRACGRIVFGDPQMHAVIECSIQNNFNGRKKRKPFSDFAGLKKQAQACA